MKTTSSLVLAGAGLALAAPGRFSPRQNQILKRTGYDVCENDCNMHGVAFPDKHTLQLSLENNWSEQCPPIYIGDDPNLPTATSRVCLDFVGSDITFSFESFPGYAYNSAAVTWQVTGNSPVTPTNNLVCGPDASTGGFLCKLPFSSVLGVSSASPIKDLLAGMCPNGDRDALGFSFEFSGQVTDGTGATASFNNDPPCTSRDATGQCVQRDTTPYIGVVYRCSLCNVAACPPPPPVVKTVCSFGTAFGYQTAQKSITLNTQSGQGCNRWGWYETPTLAELQQGISGPLYVGAGNNDISKATNVGTWQATATSQGKTTITYTLTGPYTLAEVHVNFACLPITKCAPGQYTINAGSLNDVSTYSATVNTYPVCSGGSKAALILHAAVDVTVEGTVCPSASN